MPDTEPVWRPPISGTAREQPGRVNQKHVARRPPRRHQMWSERCRSAPSSPITASARRLMASGFGCARVPAAASSTRGAPRVGPESPPDGRASPASPPHHRAGFPARYPGRAPTRIEHCGRAPSPRRFWRACKGGIRCRQARRQLCFPPSRRPSTAPCGRRAGGQPPPRDPACGSCHPGGGWRGIGGTGPRLRPGTATAAGDHGCVTR